MLVEIRKVYKFPKEREPLVMVVELEVVEVLVKELVIFECENISHFVFRVCAKSILLLYCYIIFLLYF